MLNPNVTTTEERPYDWSAEARTGVYDWAQEADATVDPTFEEIVKYYQYHDGWEDVGEEDEGPLEDDLGAPVEPLEMTPLPPARHPSEYEPVDVDIWPDISRRAKLNLIVGTTAVMGMYSLNKYGTLLPVGSLSDSDMLPAYFGKEALVTLFKSARSGDSIIKTFMRRHKYDV